MSVVDMRLYEDGSETLVFPPEDLDYGCVKSKDGDEGEWRLVTVVRWHVFRYEDKDNRDLDNAVELLSRQIEQGIKDAVKL